MVNENELICLKPSDSIVINCGLCNQQKPKYTCPKCNVLYCSLICYRSLEHVSCSENFFKECVVKELECSNQSEPVYNEMKKKMENILRKGVEGESDEYLDSDDSEDENQEDLFNRLQSVDLNDSATVWNHLNEKEKEDFHDLVTTGQILELVPKWNPWWMQKVNEKLVEDLDASITKEILDEGVHMPIIHTEIPLLSTLMKKKPHLLALNGLPNILYSYACVSRLFMQDWTGDTKPIIEILLTISAVLETNVLYESAELAIENAQAAASKLVDVSQQLSLLVKNDIYVILKHPRFVLASLSDVYCLLNNSAEKKYVSKSRVFLAMKKVEFYLSYVREYGVNSLKLY